MEASAYILRTLLGVGNRVPNALRIAACRSSGAGKRVTAVPWTWQVSRHSRANASKASSTVTAILSSSVVPKAATSARRLSHTTFTANLVTNTYARFVLVLHIGKMWTPRMLYNQGQGNYSGRVPKRWLLTYVYSAF
jgi:hypothetical protein